MQNSLGNQSAPTPQSVRIIHGAMAAGVIMFAFVAHFIMLPKANITGNLNSLVPVMLLIALGLCGVSGLLMQRVPRPSEGETAGAFWLRAAQPALVTWTPLEMAALGSVVVHSQTGSTAALVVAGVAILIFVLLRPAYFEQR
jgi:hypothetical protein